MSCGVTKCKNPSCNVKMKACKLKSGYCPTCYSQQFPNSSQKTCKL